MGEARSAIRESDPTKCSSLEGTFESAGRDTPSSFRHGRR
jgi:hypothetical protein